MKVYTPTQVRPTRKGVRRAVAWLLLATVALIMFAPASHAADTVKVKAVVTAAADLNPDYQGRPSPVNVIVFQLVSADTFSNADFFSLFEPEAAILGGDGAYPRLWDFAAFRDIENAQWRATVALPKKGFISKFFKKNKLMITVDSLAVTVSTK